MAFNLNVLTQDKQLAAGLCVLIWGEKHKKDEGGDHVLSPGHTCYLLHTLFFFLLFREIGEADIIFNKY